MSQCSNPTLTARKGRLRITALARPLHDLVTEFNHFVQLPRSDPEVDVRMEYLRDDERVLVAPHLRALVQDRSCNVEHRGGVAGTVQRLYDAGGVMREDVGCRHVIGPVAVKPW